MEAYEKKKLRYAHLATDLQLFIYSFVYLFFILFKFVHEKINFSILL